MASAKLTGGIKQQVWSSLCSAERMSRYYHILFSRFHRRKDRWRSAIAGTAAMASLLVVIGTIASPNTALLVAGASASFLAALAAWAGFVTDDARYAVVAKGAAERWQRKATEWQALWYELDDLETDQAIARLDKVKHGEELLEAEIDCGAYDDKLNKQCAEKAYAVIEQRFRPRRATEA